MDPHCNGIHNGHLAAKRLSPSDRRISPGMEDEMPRENFAAVSGKQESLPVV